MLRFFVMLILLTPHAFAEENAAKACAPLLDFTVETLSKHQPIKLCDAYQGQVILVVNTASKCGYTHQYEGLEKLYREYKDQGLVILGFPSNDFAGQEPESEEKIADFCSLTFGVEFPMFSKSSVKQGAASPFYQALAATSGSYPRWNFHKYLINRHGELIGSYTSDTAPHNAQLLSKIQQALQE
ncbi:MAG: redoxin domain-containing protein [Zetaproteobacteria bacterium]|nr:redoxin domain-containing protein [Zetaproteobacteria bacterium]